MMFAYQRWMFDLFAPPRWWVATARPRLMPNLQTIIINPPQVNRGFLQDGE